MGPIFPLSLSVCACARTERAFFFILVEGSKGLGSSLVDVEGLATEIYIAVGRSVLLVKKMP